MINDERFSERAEIIREKGTNRGQFFRDQVDKYTWVDIGSSYFPGEVIAAFLWAQMEEAQSITQKRMDIWQKYHEALVPLENAGKLRRPIVPDVCQHNAHMYYILLESLGKRTEVIAQLKKQGVNSVFHYVPLHSAPAGKEFARTSEKLRYTDDLSDRLLRLPLWVGLDEAQDFVISELQNAVFNLI